LVSNDYYRDLVETALSEELKIINKHLPYKRIGLCELLSMENPHIILRDGSINLVDRRELELLRNLLGDDACSLYIPIIIEYHPSLGEGVYVIKDNLGAVALSKLLSVEYRGSPIYIYRPQLFEIRSVLRTTTTIVFIPE